MSFNLQSVLKSLLFSTAHPISTKDIQAVFERYHAQQSPQQDASDEATSTETSQPSDSDTGTSTEPTAESLTDGSSTNTPETSEVPALITTTQIREAMDAIAEELRAEENLILTEGPNGYRLVTHPRHAPWIRALRNEPPPARLTQSQLETLAIIAYRQPITRSEIETIRGVSPEAALNRLLERELIHITGRADLPGRPLQYATTDKFLEYIGIKSTIELPASDVLTPRQIDEWLNTTAIAPAPSTTDMALPLDTDDPALPPSETLDTTGTPTQQPA